LKFCLSVPLTLSSFSPESANPQVAGLYCGALYTAQFHYQAPGWVVAKLVQG